MSGSKDLVVCQQTFEFMRGTTNKVTLEPLFNMSVLRIEQLQ